VSCAPWLVAIGVAGSVAIRVPRAGYACRMPEQQIARLRAEQLAGDAYVRWAVTHPERCPASIDDVTDDAFDPLGRTYRIICTDRHVVVMSAGADRTFGTPDDISNLRAPE